MAGNNNYDDYIRIVDTKRYFQLGSIDNCCEEETLATEIAKRLVRSAAEKGETIVSIIEQDGVRGLPVAEREVRKAKRHGIPMFLIYGLQISAYKENEDGNTEYNTVILIPRNHKGYRNICELLTLAYSPYYDKKPMIPYDEIDIHGNGLLCFDSVDINNNMLSEYGMERIAELISGDQIFPQLRLIPHFKNSAKSVIHECYKKAYSIYGNQLPDRIESRLSAELDAIINNGYSEVFSIAKMMTDKAHSDNYPIGFRGMVGSSLVAFLMDITEVNPLPPHYVCPNCRHYEEPEEPNKYQTSWDLPVRKCPCCGSEMKRDGYGIPHEVLFGYKMDREPDIDLNFTPEYCSSALKVLTDYFGEERIIRAGTVKRYGKTGTHPGGVFILPESKEAYDYSPLLRESTEEDNILVTQIDYHDLDYPLLKVDILEHKSLHHLKRLWDITGINPVNIPLDDEETINFIVQSAAERYEPMRHEELCTNDYETDYGKSIIGITNPKSLSELIKISALMHGIDVWDNNAEIVIKNGIAETKDVISTRDDIMKYLLHLGMDNERAYSIMDRVRKGRQLTDEMVLEMREYNVPDWYIESCKKLKYVFPRAHAVVYAMMDFRLIWFKVHYPEAYSDALGIVNG